MKYLFLNIILFFSFTFWGQNANETLQKFEDSLVSKMIKTRNEQDRGTQIDLNNEFEDLLRRALRYDASYTYKFEKLGKYMSTASAPDGAFRIFNWNLQIGQYEEQKYYCLIMKKDPKTGDFIIIELKDKSSKAPFDAEYVQFTEKKWYGALYYKIIPIEKAFGGTIYTFLGWDGNDMISNKKIIETMQFYRRDKVKFGQPIFRSDEDKNKRRVIFEYSKESIMSLKNKEDKKKNLLIFDHLAPMNPAVDLKSTYVPDGS